MDLIIELVANPEIDHPPLEPRKPKSPLDSGFDLAAYIPQPVEINPGERKLIPTGVHARFDFDGAINGVRVVGDIEVRPRSGNSYKKGITVLNTPGTVDHLYEGDISVILINLSDEVVTIEDGDLIAQLVPSLRPIPTIVMGKVIGSSSGERGSDGFGSTGTVGRK